MNQKLAKAEAKEGAALREATPPRLESKRDVLKFAKERGRETKKLLKRAKRKVDPEVVAQIKALQAELVAARKAENIDACRRALTDLDPLIEKHLARFQKSAVREYAEAIGLAVLFALLLRAFVVEAFQIPSESMVPTLLVGDHLFVNKFVYGLRIPFTRFDLIRFGDPDRGDVIVFIYPLEEVRTQMTLRAAMAELNQARHRDPDTAFPETLQAAGLTTRSDDWGQPLVYERVDTTHYLLSSLGPDGELGTTDDLTNDNTAVRPSLGEPCVRQEHLQEARDYIKRVIGLPGDRVRVENNIVYINDEPVPHEVIEVPDDGPRNEIGRPLTQAREVLGDAEYIIQYSDTIPNFPEITVREGYLFVMGDNRDNSSDSRCWGQVPIDNVKGEALFIFWSRGEDGGFLSNRWGRMFNGVE